MSPPIAQNAVIVPRDVHGGKGVPRFSVATGQRRHALHESPAEFPRQRVEKFAAHFFPGFLFGLFIAVYAKAERIEIIEEYVDARRHGAIGVELFANGAHLGKEPHALCLARFRHLVAQRIHHHGRVIEILGNHIGDVRRIVFGQLRGIIETGLMDIPHIAILVHDQYAQFVAGIEHGLGTGIVRTAHGVIAVLEEQTDFSLFRFGITARAQNAVVVMDASPAQNDFLPVDAKALFTVAENRAETDLFAPFVPFKTSRTGIQFRRFGRPGRYVCKGYAHTRRPVACGIRLKDSPFSVGYFQVYHARIGGMYDNLRDDGIERKRAHLEPFGQDVFFSARPEPYGTIDARARIPSAVGLIGVACNDSDLIFAAMDKTAQRDIKPHIAVRMFRRLPAVDVYFGVAIYPFKFNEICLIGNIIGQRERLDVFIVISLKPAGIHAARAFGRTFFQNHGVVRQGNGRKRSVAQMAELPIPIEICLLHGNPLCFFLLYRFFGKKQRKRGAIFFLRSAPVLSIGGIV